MTSHEKKTPEQATLGAGEPGDPERMESAAPRPQFLDVPVAYEKTDAETRPIVRIAAILGGAAVLAAVAAFGVFRLLASIERREDPPPPPLARAENRQFPEPRLQTTPMQDYEALKAQERAFLGEAGWADPAKGVARIPIEDAMALLAERAAAGQRMPMAAVPAPLPAPSGAPLAGASPPTAVSPPSAPASPVPPGARE